MPICPLAQQLPPLPPLSRVATPGAEVVAVTQLNADVEDIVAVGAHHPPCPWAGLLEYSRPLQWVPGRVLEACCCGTPAWGCDHMCGHLHLHVVREFAQLLNAEPGVRMLVGQGGPEPSGSVLIESRGLCVGYDMHKGGDSSNYIKRGGGLQTSAQKYSN
jgi:hypothetical protein